ncbi:shikimate dehydrogenase family protein [Azohydromonas caseinilytica]|uniref:Shikimate dehydrogenase n=1 Tax=Azohydromonas caseinilytica TaxID=2728836 RepID=A0A848F6R0_9BURK|nr:shikimate dehydrogenase [Azohydromonas caseinilytica]NML15787.1 shikimate dehydrogenase [Azohydromonas caseinilytica]
MRISGTTRVFMVLGDPVSQVQAPQLFNPLFERHGIDAVLVPAQVARAELPAFCRAVLAAGNIDGLWLTIPHKPLVLPLLERWDRHAETAQAVNAVRRNADGGLEGALFDGRGFCKALRHFGFEPRGRRALLVGTGGAGAAIATALLDEGLELLALNDLGDRAAQLTRLLAAQDGGTRVVAADNDPAGFDLVVNATPLGLRADDPLPFDPARLKADATVVDILMKPQGTPLLRACAERGIKAHPGFEMLVQQVPDYLDFFGLSDAAHAVRADLSSVRALVGAL